MYKVFNIVSSYSLFKINLTKILADIKDLKVMAPVGFLLYHTKSTDFKLILIKKCFASLF